MVRMILKYNHLQSIQSRSFFMYVCTYMFHHQKNIPGFEKEKLESLSDVAARVHRD